MKIDQLIPRDKFDVETANRLFDYSYDDVKSIIPELLIWIQDMNWPVAGPVSNYLESISRYLTDDIIKILQGTDDIWKYWCLHVFGLSSTKPIAEKLMIEIERIATHPTAGELEEEVADIANKILSANKSIPEP